MKRLLLAFALLWSSPVLAQNHMCPTRPAGDNTNACASTAFTTSGIAANFASPPPLGNITPNTVAATTLTTSSLASFNAAANITNGGSAGVPLLTVIDNGTIGATSTDSVIKAQEFEAFNIASGTFIPYRFAEQKNNGGLGHRTSVIMAQFGGNSLSTEFMTGSESVAQATAGMTNNSGIWTGSNPVCAIPSGMDASVTCVGTESDIFLASTAAKKVSVAAADVNSTSSGTLIDAAFQAYKGPSAVGFQHGLLFGDDVNAARFPVMDSGYLIRAAPSAVNLNAAIDFSGLSGTFGESTIKLRALNQFISWWSGGAATGGQIKSNTTTGGGALIFTSGDTVIQTAIGNNAFHATDNGTEALRFINRAGIPTIPTCGTSPTIAGVNAGGTFTTGTGTPTTCQIVFATLQAVAGWPTNAWCTVSPANAASAAISGGWYISIQSKTGFTITLGTGTDSAAFNYNCVGN